MMTVLPLPPFLTLLIAVGVGTLLLYGALSLMQRGPNTPVWEGWTPGWVAVFIVLGICWTGLFGLGVLATFAGTWAMVSDPAVASIGLGGLVVALLGAPFLIWSTVLKHQTLRYQKEGHITDRINKAVEQLGAEKTVRVHTTADAGDVATIEETRPNIEVRTGAILSLERIAQDSTRHDNGRDHVRVMEILCAYIRENSNARPPADYPEPDWEPLGDNPTAAKRGAHVEARERRFGEILWSTAYWWARNLQPPRVDVQLALSVIGRRDAQQRRVEAAWPNPPDSQTIWPFDIPCPDITDIGTDENSVKAFSAALDEWIATIDAYRGYRLDLRGANLQRADMSARRLDRSDAVFSGAEMNNARMEGVKLDAARIEGADLGGVRLHGASLQQGWMQGTRLSSSNMEGAVFEQATLDGAVVTSASMNGVDLSKASMQFTKLWWSIMEAAKFDGTRMENTDLGFAKLDGARFRSTKTSIRTDFREARTCNAKLQKLDISATSLTQEQINATFGDASVILPDHITRPAHWPEMALADYFDKLTYSGESRKWLADPANYTPPAP